MKTLRTSVYAAEQQYLRTLWKNRRLELKLSQRDLAARMAVIYSFVGKVETGDRRLDIFEFMAYCRALELNPEEVIRDLSRFSL